jgi:hypothetical protein
MNVLSIIWGFVQKNWQAILLVAVIAVGYGWIHHMQAGFADTLKQLNDAHQTEITQINTARAQEEQQHAVELKQLQDSIAKIQADYAEAQAALRVQQTVEQKAIVKKYGNDADGLANLLAGRMGFTVVKPAVQ